MNRAGILTVCVVMVALPAGCGPKAPPGAGPDAAASAIPPDKELGVFVPVPGTPFLVAPIVDLREQGRELR